MTTAEIDYATDKLYAKFGNVPGVDRNFIRKCLQGIASLRDNEVDEKIKLFMRFL